MRLRNQDSRFPRLSMKAMTGEAALLESRRDEGEPFPVGAEKRISKVDGAGARSGVMRRYSSALGSRRGMQAKEWGDSHPREAARLVVCQ